jgi:AP-3 complex subunit delta
LPESSIAFSRDDSVVEPNCPKSLYLIRPLFTSYELNPVAPNAQASVPIPEGLDLDAWIVPPPPDLAAGIGRKAKGKKGKEKEKNESADQAGKRKKRKENVEQVTDSLSVEEQAQREKVASPFFNPTK